MALFLTADVSAPLEDVLTNTFANFALEKLLEAVVVAVLCLVVIKILMRLVDRMLNRIHGLDSTIKRLTRGALKGLFLFVAIVVVMGCLGIPVTSLVAVLSVVGLALSLAVQNFLSNVAGGLQMVASKPFQLGDFVEAGGCSGTVDQIGLFYTKLLTVDNKLVQIPNSSIVSANIINYTSQETRRVELLITASYDAPCEKVMEVLNRVVGEHPLTLATPEPMVHVNGYQDSAIQYVVRVWCATEDYWTVYYDLLDRIKPAFDQAGVEMTYPHVNVHMVDP